MNKYLILSALLFSSFVNASGGTGSGVITSMYVNNGWTMVHVPDLISTEMGSKNNPDSCASNYYFAIMPTDQNYSTIHATLMAAQMAGKKVKFWVNGCKGQNNSYPHIVSVWIIS